MKNVLGHNVRLLLAAALALAPGCSTPEEQPGAKAELSVVCANPGQPVTLTVRTDPGVPVLYLAIYADGESGAVEPLGAGYGGNDGGFADAEGTYVSTWTVGNDAPEGDVDVLVFLPAGADDPTSEDSDSNHEEDVQEHASEESSPDEGDRDDPDEATGQPTGDFLRNDAELELHFRVGGSSPC